MEKQTIALSNLSIYLNVYLINKMLYDKKKIDYVQHIYQTLTTIQAYMWYMHNISHMQSLMKCIEPHVTKLILCVTIDKDTERCKYNVIIAVILRLGCEQIH